MFHILALAYMKHFVLFLMLGLKGGLWGTYFLANFSKFVKSPLMVHIPKAIAMCSFSGSVAPWIWPAGPKVGAQLGAQWAPRLLVPYIPSSLQKLDLT